VEGAKWRALSGGLSGLRVTNQIAQFHTAMFYVHAVTSRLRDVLQQTEGHQPISDSKHDVFSTVKQSNDNLQ
jgi:hypothetical protein